jgi:hypothetical protein
VLLCLTEIKLNYLKIVIHNRMHSVKIRKCYIRQHFRVTDIGKRQISAHKQSRHMGIAYSLSVITELYLYTTPACKPVCLYALGIWLLLGTGFFQFTIEINSHHNAL